MSFMCAIVQQKCDENVVYDVSG